MIYGSVCSGIEAATAAWHQLGWTPAFFSEIEPFPRAVLAHHYPDTPLLGDFTKLRDTAGIADVELLVGGTPCQAFSVAGLRKSMSDERGNLTLEFVRLADAIDVLRCGAGKPRATILWENVPGVLSTKDNAFGCFLAALVGADAPIARKRRRKWTNAGLVVGPKRRAAWRVLDAQYFGLAQRRARLFVVASPRDGIDPSQVLFEPEGMRRHSAPRREAGPPDSALTADGVGTCGADDNQAQAGHLIAGTLSASYGEQTGQDGNNGMLMIPYGIGGQPDCGHALTATATATATGHLDPSLHTYVAHTLRGEGFDGSEDGTGRGIPLVPVAFDCKASAGFQTFREDGVTPTLRSMGHKNGHQNAGGQLAVAYDLRGRDGGSVLEGPHDTANIRSASGGSCRSYIAKPMAVRRLTPKECSRLQGFPDDFAKIPWKGKSADLCPDGPQYRVYGNSMAVNVMLWLGKRIEMHMAEKAGK